MLPEVVLLEVDTHLHAGERAELAALLSGHRTLEQVVRWTLARTPPATIADVVVQDEFTHDVIVPWTAGRYLVYDTT